MLILHEAIKADDWEQVKQLLDEGADVNAPDEDGMTPLMLALGTYDSSMIGLMLWNGARLDAKDHSGRTVLMVALEYGSLYPIKLMEEEASEGQTLTFDSATASSATALLYAIYTQDEPAMRDLLDAGADPNAKTFRDSSPLHWAAEVGHAEGMRLLLKHGTDMHARDNNGETALHIAAVDKHPECVKVLLEHGAEVDARSSEQLTPLICAALASSAPSARLLLEYGADIHAEDHEQMSALSAAGWVADEETIRTLLEWGAAAHEGHLRDAFFAAFTDNNQDKAPLFLEAGLPVGLREAVMLRDEALVQDFLSKGAEQEERNAALVKAAGDSSLEIVSLLLRGGADPNAVHHGQTPLVAARQRIDSWLEKDVTELLLKAGAVKEPRA